MKKYLTIVILITVNSILFAQQNEEFKKVKSFFDRQENLLKTEFLNQYKKEKDTSKKTKILKDFSLFMKKLDSVRNVAYIGTLIKVRNFEDLQKIYAKNRVEQIPQKEIPAEINSFPAEESPEYPDGIDSLRKQIAEILYTKAVISEKKQLRSEVTFVVEKDGSITSVQANGEDDTFNKQAVIAMYLLPNKFIKPARNKGNTVRYKYKIPLTIVLN